MCESWISKKSSISVSPVSSLQFRPRGPNFLFQLSKHWLQRALIGATGKKIQDSSLYLRNTLNLLYNRIKTQTKWYMSKSVKTNAPVLDYNQVYFVKIGALIEFRFIVYRISFASLSFQYKILHSLCDNTSFVYNGKGYKQRCKCNLCFVFKSVKTEQQRSTALVSF